MTRSDAFAPAKINLTLHVTGQRADGYHLLESLVVFADIGDRLTLTPAPVPLLTIKGPMAAGVPVDGRNLVLRAAQAAGVTGLSVVLDKQLPAAAGIGGGSSDAAAALRGIADLGLASLPSPDTVLDLGADVPVCLRADDTVMSGIGETLTPVAGLPRLAAVLVNPGVAVPTPGVFAALARKDNAAMAPLPRGGDAAAVLQWLRAQRNDLEAPARAIEPVIGTVLASLVREGAALARMSGSGATCFGVFADRDAAAAAAARLVGAAPGWWVRACTLGGDRRAG